MKKHFIMIAGLTLGAFANSALAKGVITGGGGMKLPASNCGFVSDQIELGTYTSRVTTGLGSHDGIRLMSGGASPRGSLTLFLIPQFMTTIV